MRITVIGCGYLGATHAACMAELGHEVLGVETEEARRKSLAAGSVPFFEPGLDELLQRHVDSGSLRFTDSSREAAEFGDVHFVCVGTPQLPDSMAADVSQLEAAIEQLAPHLRDGALVIGKSTVPVGTAAALAQRLTELAPGTAELAWNPEFLREGFAIQDTVRPDRLVFGVTSPGAEARLRDIYAAAIAAGSPVVVTDFPTAELVKVSANAFLATKISFINAVAEVCDVAGADVVALADALGHDGRIGRKFLNAGIGFGGGCLPKDLRAFVHRAGELGLENTVGLLREVDNINQFQRQRVVQIASAMVADLPSARVTVLGAAFKPNSDDVRDSPALSVAGQLHLAGADVRVHDPKAMDNARRRFPTLTYVEDAREACRGADLVLHLTEWSEYRDLDPHDLGDLVGQRAILDGRNVLDPARWRAAGWTFRALGRP